MNVFLSPFAAVNLSDSGILKYTKQINCVEIARKSEVYMKIKVFLEIPKSMRGLTVNTAPSMKKKKPLMKFDFCPMNSKTCAYTIYYLTPIRTPFKNKSA